MGLEKLYVCDVCGESDTNAGCDSVLVTIESMRFRSVRRFYLCSSTCASKVFDTLSVELRDQQHVISHNPDVS
jgi:hypothetical protein